MWLVVGLGNPGLKYANNRHNIGFQAVQAIAIRYHAHTWQMKDKFGGEICECREPPIYFLKPQTFMNLSGESVGTAARFYKIPVEKVIVLHDDLDLPVGKLRVKQGGGSGGHNGLKSIDDHIGENYWRVRIGVGRPQDKDRVTEYVLSDFIKAEREAKEIILPIIAEHFELLLKGDSAGFMNQVALSQSPPPLRGKVREGGPIVGTERVLRKNMTDTEKKLWYHLRRENITGCKFRRQHPLDFYVADFICLDKKLIIEVDGSQHAEMQPEDAARTAYFAKTGHKVLRFWNNEVLQNMDGVLQTIATELAAR